MVFAGVRVCYSVAHAIVVVAQVTAAVVGANAGFTDECPTVVTDSEKAWEGVALAEFRLLVHCVIGNVILLVAWFRAHPPLVVAIYLRTDKGGCPVRKQKTACFGINSGAAWFVTKSGLGALKRVAIGNVVVAYLHGKSHDALCAFGCEVKLEFVCLVVIALGFCATHGICIVDGALAMRLYCQGFGVVAHLGVEAES